ncbi:YnjH family protein [Vibrio sp. YIC-376]|uniref:YnjH family protein n=1 Tax=Vibrio sp. YIC-376 TaxID=3136162 RepID=UPI00402AAC05
MKLKSVSTITVCATMALLSGQVFSKSYSTAESKALVVADGKLGQRLCYYEDKAYTVGAVIKVDDVLIECAAENDFEMNGSLKWVVLNKK